MNGKENTMVDKLLGLVKTPSEKAALDPGKVIVHCVEPMCTNGDLAERITGAWAYGQTPNQRYCPDHSIAAAVIPNPHDLTPPERFNLFANNLDPSTFLGLSLMGNMQIAQTPHGFVIMVQGPMPPILRPLRQTSRLLGPDGQPQVEQMPLAMPPSIRLVLPRDMLTDEARVAIEKTEADPQRWKRPAAAADKANGG